MERQLIAAFQSISGKHTAELFEDSEGGHDVELREGGSLWAGAVWHCSSRDEAITRFIEGEALGLYQPHLNTTPMRRIR
jgi:hypothetical protein